MEMKRCQNGHFYDASMYPTCPYCQGKDANATVPLRAGNGPVPGPGPAPGVGATVPVQNAGGPGPGPAPAPGMGGGVGATVPVQNAGGFQPNDVRPMGNPRDAGKTVAVMRQKSGINPVVGWLVCVEGKEKGRDFRLHTGNNLIGRADHMDICLKGSGDETISRENQGVISYDRKHRNFYVSPGKGENLMYLNDEPVLGVEKLKMYDKLEIGSELLMFVPLCGEEFQWEKEEKE